MSTDGCVRFCESYALICPASNPHWVELGWSVERPNTILAADCENSLVVGDVVVSDNNGVVASTCVQSVARSVFQIYSPQATPDGCVVAYGVPVQFRLANTNISSERVYLASDNSSPMSSTRMSGHQHVFLTTDRCSFLTHWKLEHQNPQLRMETEGCPVKSDTLVVIKHCKTNTAIAVEDRFSKKYIGLMTEDVLDYTLPGCSVGGVQLFLEQTYFETAYNDHIALSACDKPQAVQLIFNRVAASSSRFGFSFTPAKCKILFHDWVDPAPTLTPNEKLHRPWRTN